LRTNRIGRWSVLVAFALTVLVVAQPFGGGAAQARHAQRARHGAQARARGGHQRTIVSLQWDDGSAHQIAVRRILRIHGFHATFFINSDRIDTPGFMTWDQVAALASDGNEIAGHTLKHQGLPHLTVPLQRHQICDDRVALFAHGFRVTSFAYPYGSLSERTERIVEACGYNSGRGVYGVLSSGCDTGDPCPAAEKIPPPDPYFTRTTEAPVQDTTLATLKEYVRVAERHHGGWVQIFFHKVCGGCDEYSTRLSILRAFFRWLEPRSARGTVVRTVDAVIGGTVKPPVPA
jgi:peptidoglycan/xylan/chitin deacetylase (PgdA/CDA1 family)